MSEYKFKLTTETKINAWGVKLFRIEATVDIPSRNVKKGDKGGWVESEKLSNGNARVSGNAWVYGDAEVSGNARVFGNARVYGDAEVFGNARVFGDARVSLKRAYTKGKFVYSNDTQINTTIVNDADEDDFDCGSDYKNHLIVGDYEINKIEEPKEAAPEPSPDLITIQIGQTGFSVPKNVAEDLQKALNETLDKS